MKEKVLNILKPLMQPKGFKQDELESIADLISANLKAESSEEEVKASVENFVPYADLMQKIGNRYATGVETKYKGFVSEEHVKEEIEKAKKEAVELYKKLNPMPVPTSTPQQDPSAKQDPSTPVPAPTPQPKPEENFAELFKKMQEQQSQYQSALQKQMAELISKGVNDALKPYREKNEREYLDNLLNSNEKVKAIPETFRKAYRLDKEENLSNLVNQMTTDYAALKQELMKTGEFVTPPAKGSQKQDEDEVVSFLSGMAKAEPKK